MKSSIKKAISAVLATFALLISGTAANATGWWPPVQFSCPVGKVGVLKLNVVSGSVIVGVGITEWDAGHTPFYKVLAPGIRTINTGMNAGFWQKWADAGNGTITTNSYTCVNYLFATPAP